METSIETINALLSYFPKDLTGWNILEPSAGNGKLASVIRDRGANVTCVELNNINHSLLNQSGFTSIHANFLSISHNTLFQQRQFDAAISVPPYKDNDDILHIKGMYRCIRPGGKLVSLTLPHWTTGFFSHQREFRNWLQDKVYTLQLLPDSDESYLNAPKMIIEIIK